jgi:Sigma-70 region 2
MQGVLVKAAKINGEQMDALLKRFERPLLQYATRILGDSDRPRDVVQETFVKLQHESRTELDHAPAKWHDSGRHRFTRIMSSDAVNDRPLCRRKCFVLFCYGGNNIT